MEQTRAVHGTGKMVAALAALLLVIAGEVLGMLLGLGIGGDLDLWATIGGAVVAAAMVAALGGRGYLRYDRTAMVETWKFMWWIMAITVMLMLWDLASYLEAGEAVQPGWLLRCLNSLALCLAIGIVEEGMFRGLLFGGILARFGGRKGGIYWAAGISSVLFGCAHVSPGDLDPGNLLTFAQAGLKVCQTGMYALMLCAVMLKTKNLLGAMCLHAIDDWLLFIVSTGLFGETFETDYVTQDVDDAVITCLFYLVICLLYLPTFIRSIRELRRVEVPQFGPFIAEKDVAEEAPPVMGGVGYGECGPAAVPQMPGDFWDPYQRQAQVPPQEGMPRDYPAVLQDAARQFPPHPARSLQVPATPPHPIQPGAGPKLPGRPPRPEGLDF